MSRRAEIGGMYQLQDSSGQDWFCVVDAVDNRGVCIGHFARVSEENEFQSVDVEDNRYHILKFGDRFIVELKWPLRAKSRPILDESLLALSRKSFSGVWYLERYSRDLRLISSKIISQSEADMYPRNQMYGDVAVEIWLSTLRMES